MGKGAKEEQKMLQLQSCFCNTANMKEVLFFSLLPKEK